MRRWSTRYLTAAGSLTPPPRAAPPPCSMLRAGALCVAASGASTRDAQGGYAPGLSRVHARVHARVRTWRRPPLERGARPMLTPDAHARCSHPDAHARCSHPDAHARCSHPEDGHWGLVTRASSTAALPRSLPTDSPHAQPPPSASSLGSAGSSGTPHPRPHPRSAERQAATCLHSSTRR